MPELEKKPTVTPTSMGPQGICQVCGKKGVVVYAPEKSPPNRLCYRCAAEYGMQDSDDE